jgi:MFS family permease
VLERFDFPIGFVIAFATAGLLIFLSWVFVAQIREPAVASSKPRISQVEYLRTLPAVLRRDRNFRRFMIAQVINATSQMAGGFLIVYAVQQWNLPASYAGWFTIAMQFGQAAANLFFGFLSDRKGHKLNLEISALLNAASFGLAFFAPSPVWFFVIFFLRGAVFSVNILSGMAIVMEFCAPENRPTYIGMANTIPGIASSLAPLLGGLLAGSFGYLPVFILSGLFGVAGLSLLRLWVQEPRKQAIVALQQSEVSLP